MTANDGPSPPSAMSMGGHADRGESAHSVEYLSSSTPGIPPGIGASWRTKAPQSPSDGSYSPVTV